MCNISRPTLDRYIKLIEKDSLIEEISNMKNQKVILEQENGTL